MEAILTAITENWLISSLVGLAIFWTVFSSIESIVETCARERSRREIAAYIAEGSMKPEEGERLLKAGKKSVI